MKLNVLLIALVLSTQLSFGQSDTAIVYFNRLGNETTKDSALTYAQFYKKENLWHGKQYLMNGKLKSEGDYAAKDFKTPVGSFDNYNDDGSLDNKAVWENGRLKERTYFNKDGSKKSYIAYNDKGVSVSKGWDKKGNEIPGFIVEKQAMFKGGAPAWQKYLEKNLDTKVPVDAGVPAGNYTVVVEFLVDKGGYITQVKAISVPAKCKPCATEAVRVIAAGPGWEPAMLNNVPVTYRQLQSVTFQVSEDKKKNKKDE